MHARTDLGDYMPIQKGKQRKKPRNRIRREPLAEGAETPTTAAPKSHAAKPVARVRRQPPLWLNIMLGIIMAVAGPYFTIYASKGLGTAPRLLLLLGYLLIAGYYFGKAYRQYKRRATV
jgi:hypothetical protein